ncbi:hypothetical protein KSB_29190 [Ktedonobacter robiniae]|uniref:Uncharacterized protein n=1 Tax=Ktedonobacter robiniae TaxID=2778365 RepID=A0ABQ3UNX6_9CHLR|nr:hypothetical protein KSB_29190 [Ktedonobacter robiniae]
MAAGERKRFSGGSVRAFKAREQTCVETVVVLHVERERIPSSVKEAFQDYYDEFGIAYQCRRTLGSDCTPSIDSLCFWSYGLEDAP